MRLATLPLDSIDAGYNPRVAADPERHRELTDSVRRYGVLQPIIVVEAGDRYEVVAGRRRYLAARAAELSEIPVVIRDPGNRLIEGLIENLQRESMRPMDEAVAFRHTIDSLGITEAELARRLGVSPPRINNSLVLLRLEPEVVQMLNEGELSAGHARVIARQPTQSQVGLAHTVTKQKLSVRQIEQRAAARKARRTAEASAAARLDEEARQIIDYLAGDVTRLMLVHERALVDRLRPHGIPATKFDPSQHTVVRSYTCECTALYVGNGVVSACVVKDHAAAARAEAVARRREFVAQHEQLLRGSRRSLTHEITDSGHLSDLGMRLVLYRLINSLSEHRAKQGFMKRYGAPADGDVWETITGMVADDVTTEVTHLLVLDALPNVISDPSRSTRSLRLWLVAQYKLDERLVG